ncbi:DUF5624 domain-containing protein [Sphingobium cupriresistens]|uniref:DUF5624 domain-containing protein n=1 Tax=Sphingobium cupriresistens LL01 TaxID=1420583 RepID=A0A0J7XP60_9SPHN|nr:DUF5624 domain-containing protein [Sphingobium cupriresistens]KMS53414.1 hypothetical protein V473_20640 [Sphingobium cupriresistens LL01]
MRYETHPEFKMLFELFTSTPNSIGTQLQRRLGAAHADDPLLVATGSDLVLFPGSGQPPVTESFRLSTRGFFELTGVSHLGIAIPYLARLREAGFAGWESHARALITQCHSVRHVNSIAYWRDTVAVEAWAGLEDKITDLIDYSCAVTADYLERSLADPTLFDFEYMRANLLEGDGPDALPVPLNDMMAATFALVFLDTGYRIINWLHAQNIRWERLMVMISGRAGRPTAGVTWQTNSMCHLLYQASARKLNPERLLIAPHAPGLVLRELASPEFCARAEADYRHIWYSSLSSVEMSRLMWPDYPAFTKAVEAAPVVDPETRTVTEIPMVRSVHDRRAIISRLRHVMEDPAQQIAMAGSQFMIDQLCANGNRPELVEIPGFTHIHYPKGYAQRYAS